MADSDYTVRGEGALTTVGFLVADIAHLDTAMTITGLKVTDPTATAIGRPAMIDDEIVRVDAVNGDIVTIARGCADTIPAAHEAGAPVWFFDMEMGTDRREYLAGETIAVKPLVHTPNSIPMTVASVPPRQLTFNQRFNRPYPPAEFKCKNDYWFTEVKELSIGSTELVWTWNHRDRLLQADQLIDHNDGDIGPEAGTTYTARVYTNEDVLVRTVTGIVGKTWSYLRTDAVVDLPDGVGYVIVHSVRGGVESLYGYRTEVVVAIAMTNDPYFSNVVALLHMDGVGGSQTFNDDSTSSAVVEVYGNVVVNNSHPKFGNGCAYFDGVGSFLTLSHATAFKFGTGPYTIEFWYRPVTNDYQPIVTCYATWPDSVNFDISIDAGDLIYQAGDNTPLRIDIIEAVTLNTYHHIAVSRDSAGVTRFFVNGLIAGTSNVAVDMTVQAPVGVGGDPTFNEAYLNAYIDELRITKGVARYTANFTPAIVPFPNA